MKLFPYCAESIQVAAATAPRKLNLSRTSGFVFLRSSCDGIRSSTTSKRRTDRASAAGTCDWDELFAVASDSLIWEQHPERDRYKEDVFRIFFKDALESGGAFVIIDRKTQHIIGSTRFYGYDQKKSEIEIGWTFLARKYWGGRFNAEMKRLLLNHAFRFVESVVFFVGEDNVRSQKAMEKVGAIKVGTATRAYGNHRPLGT